MRNLTTLLTAVMLALPGIAHAADAPVAPPCLTPAEFTSLASYTLPSAITGISQRCAASLAPGSFLGTDAGALSARYASAKPAAWPGAKAAFFKLSSGASSGAVDAIKSMPDATQQQLVDTLIAGAVAQHLPLDRCLPVDRLLRLLAPLPPESTAEIIGLAVGLGSRAGTAHIGRISICSN